MKAKIEYIKKRLKDMDEISKYMEKINKNQENGLLAEYYYEVMWCVGTIRQKIKEIEKNEIYKKTIKRT